LAEISRDEVFVMVRARRYVTGVTTATQNITIDEPLAGVNLYNLEDETVRDHHFESKDAVLGNNDDDFDVRWDPLSIRHFLLDDMWTV
jgi:hypothetical protein